MQWQAADNACSIKADACLATGKQGHVHRLHADGRAGCGNIGRVLHSPLQCAGASGHQGKQAECNTKKHSVHMPSKADGAHYVLHHLVKLAGRSIALIH